jgi:AcrR family transcriptional regulator
MTERGVPPEAVVDKTLPTGRSDGRRAALIQQAASLFDAWGYHNTSVNNIARAAGIKKPTLYHYFSSKHEILFWIHEEFIDLLIARHEARLRTTMSPRQSLLEVMGDILELMDTHRGHVRVFFEHYRELPEEQQAAIKIKRDKYTAMVEAIIRTGVEQGEFSPDPPPRGAGSVRSRIENDLLSRAF